MTEMSRPRMSRRFLAIAFVVGTLAASSYVYGLLPARSFHPTETRRVSADYVAIGLVAYQAPVAQASASQQSVALNENAEPLLGITVRPLRRPWTANKDIREQVNVLVMNNFDSEYLQGGLIPRRGAEISIVVDASQKSIPAVDTLIADFLKGDKSSAITKTKVAGCDTEEVESESAFSPSLVYKRMAVFMRGRYKDSFQVSKFILSYNAGDDEVLGKSFKEAFKQVLASAATTPLAGCLQVGTH